jgi:predicted nucleic acid-binding protein
MKVKIVKGEQTEQRKEEAYQIIGEFLRKTVNQTKAS